MQQRVLAGNHGANAALQLQLQRPHEALEVADGVLDEAVRLVVVGRGVLLEGGLILTICVLHLDLRCLQDLSQKLHDRSLVVAFEPYAVVAQPFDVFGQT